jgi:hypothetical protein
MKEQMKTDRIGDVTISETTEGNAVTLEIGSETATLTREELRKLFETGEELLSKKIVLTCETCGNELAGTVDLDDSTATLKVAPCQACAGKDHVTL